MAMYAYLNGTITDIKPSHVVLDHMGIGYHILSPNPYSYQLGSEVKIYTYHHVREDVFSLYGFRTEEAKDLFIRLISVSGIGPKSALSLLATDRISDIMVAIEDGNVKFLTKFPGIGTKSAQQIILDLKGKLIETEELVKPQTQDVEQALSALGYSKIEIKKVLKKIDIDRSVEDMIKDALKLLMK